jgi:TonB-dependent SusC/RagA subfamily outer membrane receptor
VEAARYGSLVEELDLDSGMTVVLPIVITPVAVLLDQLSVRANRADRASGARRGTVAEGDLAVRGAPTATDALTARVPGARVLFYGGSVGLATQILLRGVKSLSLAGDPLYYVDGVLMPAPVPTTRGRFGQASILDLIAPETIERIEVIAGAAASATFGLGANNGVILIYTKR